MQFPKVQGNIENGVASNTVQINELRSQVQIPGRAKIF